MMATPDTEIIPPLYPNAPEVATTPICATDSQVSAKPAAVEESGPASTLDDQDFIANLALMKPTDYDRIRKEKAREFGVQVKTLDDLVKVARKGDVVVDRLPFPEVEPYPDPIDPAQLLDLISETLLQYVVMTKEQADAAALWIALTWFIDAVEVAAIAIITAPEKACGKSQLLDLFGRMVARPLSAASSSASFLFRAISAWRPTILIDEADTFIRENDELKGLVNAGHTRANAYVGRTVAVGDTHEPRLFDVWGAKAFAGIALEKHLPDATMSRGIVFNLRRKLPHESVGRLRHAAPNTFTDITSKLARFADDYSRQVRLARPHLPEELSDRSQDNWESLLAIAECAGPAWVERATVAAMKLSSAGELSVSSGNELLADIQSIFVRKAKAKVTKGELKVSTVHLIDALCKIDDAAWATYNRGKPLSPRQLAKLLATYGIKSKTVRLGDTDTPKGYDASQFEDAFARYLISPVKLSPQRNGVPNGTIGEAEGVVDEMQPPDIVSDTGGF